MARSADALIHPELLVWARESAGMALEEAAQHINKITPEKLQSWESGKSRPTVKQLRKVATVYKQSFAAFYLPEAPKVFRPPLKDYRLFPGDTATTISSEVALDSRLALDRREITLELYAERGEEVPRFTARTTLRKNLETLGEEIRKLLGVTNLRQRSWKVPRAAFNAWREFLEAAGVLVFQSARIDLAEMRGYSIWADPLPIIVVNRKDAYTARSFTLLHELTHLLLRSAGICDLDFRPDRPPEEQRIEVFCNGAAGAALVPRSDLLAEPEVKASRARTWADNDLQTLSLRYGVSREVVLRRLLNFGRTTEEFYQASRTRFEEERASRAPPMGGFVPPATNAVSLAGKPFVRLVLDALNTDRITTSDASDYLGVKLHHLARLEQAVGAA